jgi:carboxylesterase type B
MNDNEKILSDQIIQYYSNFAKFSNPNNLKKNNFIWPSYYDSKKFIDFKIKNLTVNNNFRDKVCDFWDSVGIFIFLFIFRL